MLSTFLLIDWYLFLILLAPVRLWPDTQGIFRGQKGISGKGLGRPFYSGIGGTEHGSGEASGGQCIHTIVSIVPLCSKQ